MPFCFEEVEHISLDTFWPRANRPEWIEEPVDTITVDMFVTDTQTGHTVKIYSGGMVPRTMAYEGPDCIWFESKPAAVSDTGAEVVSLRGNICLWDGGMLPGFFELGFSFNDGPEDDERMLSGDAMLQILNAHFARFEKSTRSEPVSCWARGTGLRGSEVLKSGWRAGFGPSEDDGDDSSEGE